MTAPSNDDFFSSLEHFAWVPSTEPTEPWDYSFKQTFTFAAPCASLPAAKALHAQYAEYLELLEMQATLHASAMAGLAVLTIGHPAEGEKFFGSAQRFIERILNGDAQLSEHMNARQPANGYGDKIIAVHAVGSLTESAEGWRVAFESHVQGAEKDPVTGQFISTIILF